MNIEIGRLPARSARTACVLLPRGHHIAILNTEGRGDGAYEAGHVVRYKTQHARAGGARFCPPPVGGICYNQCSRIVSLGMALMWASCRGRRLYANAKHPALQFLRSKFCPAVCHGLQKAVERRDKVGEAMVFGG